jgi:hypothetical protein
MIVESTREKGSTILRLDGAELPEAADQGRCRTTRL